MEIDLDVDASTSVSPASPSDPLGLTSSSPSLSSTNAIAATSSNASSSLNASGDQLDPTTTTDPPANQSRGNNNDENSLPPPIKKLFDPSKEDVDTKDGLLTTTSQPYPPIPPSGTRLKVNIVRWNALATWRWIANDDSCGICRMPFDATCAGCKIPGDDCPLVWGKCSHCFHMHCILQWLQSQNMQQQCPMCRQDWEFKE